MEDKKGLISHLAEQIDNYNDERFEELKGLLNNVLERLEKVDERLERIEAAGAQVPENAEDDSALYEPMTSADDEEEMEETYRDEDEEDEEEVAAEESEEEKVEDGDDEEVEEAEEKEEEVDGEVEEEDDDEDEAVVEDDDNYEEAEEEEEADEGAEEDNQPDWYDWEVDYPQEKVDDLVGSMGMNDKMQFIGELFDGDAELFNETMHQIEMCANFKEVKNYLMESFGAWDFRGDAVYNFMMHLRRKFN